MWLNVFCLNRRASITPQIWLSTATAEVKNRTDMYRKSSSSSSITSKLFLSHSKKNIRQKSQTVALPRMNDQNIWKPYTSNIEVLRLANTTLIRHSHNFD